MTDDRIEGALRQGVGRVQDAVGGLTGDARTQARGKLNQAAGATQDAAGQVRDRVQDIYDEIEGYAKAQPLLAIGIALGVGAVLGAALLGGRKTIYLRK